MYSRQSSTNNMTDRRSRVKGVFRSAGDVRLCTERLAILLLFMWSLIPGVCIAAGSASPNVVFVTIDTLRADHLGCYGFTQVQTPNIDALAKGSIRFAEAFTAVPITLPSHTAIFTGSYPMATGMHDFSGNKLPPVAMTLARVLRDNGYSTAAFIGAAVLDSRFGLNLGFDTYFDHFDFSRLDETNLDEMERRGDLVMDEALEWLKVNPRQPFLLWVHLYDPHFPYKPPEPYATRYHSHLYDGEIAFDDAQVGRLLSFLKSTGIFENSIIVLCGDHGEGLGEHGEKTHGFFVYDSTLHVPVIMKLLGITPRVVKTEVSLVDIMPTVLQSLGIPIPKSVQGRSLLDEVMGRTSAGRSYIYSETYLPLLHFKWSQLRGWQINGLHYIDAPRPELYDTRTDPHEVKNLFNSKKVESHALHDELFTFLRHYTPSAGGGAQAKELTDPALLERLKSLGYVAISATSYSDNSGRPLPDPKDRIQVYELFSEAMSDSQHGRYDASLSKLQEASKTDPNSLPIHYLMALNLYREKDYQQALTAFQETLQLDPKFALATYYLGLTYSQTGNYGSAIDSFSKALQLDSTNFQAAFAQGAAFLRLNRVPQAISSFERATQIYPDFAKAYEALGEIYIYQKRYDEAVQALEKAVVIAPDMQKAHYELGRAYEAKGLHDKAQREFGRAKN